MDEKIFRRTFPLPVGAHPITSFPCSIAGMQPVCTTVGTRRPIDLQLFATHAFRPSASQPSPVDFVAVLGCFADGDVDLTTAVVSSCCRLRFTTFFGRLPNKELIPLLVFALPALLIYFGFFLFLFKTTATT